jgi:hypothetical protein
MLWGAVAGAAISAGASYFGGKSAEDKARQATQEQSKLTLMQREEQQRQRKLGMAANRSAMRAGVYASNLQNTGTSQSYLKTELYQNLRQLAWQDRSDQMEAEAIRNGADGAGDAMKISGFSNAASTIVSSAIDNWGE